ncbi:MAG: GNAT family N-acetyltransferase [Phycisphaerae bacterium]|nr:GNAT family N-acetyltransferase [Phycisphaerae bacterium]
MPRIPDLELARRLEGAEAASARAFCDAAAGVHPGRGIRSIACGGGFGLFYGPGDPLNAVKGVGLNGPVGGHDWDAMEGFFRGHESPVVIDLCPLADGDFVAMLGQRGYRIGSFETVTFRPIDVEMPEPPPIAGCRIGPPEDAAVWGRVLDVGFADGGEPMKFAVDFGKVRERLASSRMLLATVDGRPAGAANMSIHEGVAHMGGAAVLPEFRRRGLQGALTAARLRLARAHGCELAKLDVHAGSGSHRNAERAGFRVAYTRPQMIRSW